MGVSPLDMQVMIPKTVDVAKQQSLEAHKINGDQQNIVQKENERQSEDTKKVHDRNKTEKIYVDEEEKEKKEKDNDNDKSNKKKEDKAKKKQSAKLNAASVLKVKKDISNELGGGGANTGDAFLSS